jgi:hypothetical protein
MSATIYWRPGKQDNNKYLHNVSSASHFMSTLKNAGIGELPTRLSRHWIPTLNGMVAMCEDQEKNPYQELIDLLDKYDEIELYAQY